MNGCIYNAKRKVEIAKLLYSMIMEISNEQEKNSSKIRLDGIKNAVSKENLR